MGIPEDAEVWGRLAGGGTSELVLEMGTDRQRWGEFGGPGVFEKELG